MAPPKTKMVKEAMMRVVWRMASESVMSVQVGSRAACAGSIPPHDAAKSLAA